MGIDVPVVRSRSVSQNSAPAVFQNIDAPAAAFGGAQARAMIDMGDAVSRIAEQGKRTVINQLDEQNELFALETQAHYTRELNKAMFDPESGILTRKGRNALGADSDIQSTIGKFRSEFQSRQNIAPDVMRMMDKFFIDSTEKYTSLAGRHQFGEYLQYKQDTLDSKMTANLEEASLNFSDDKAFHSKVEEQNKLLEAQAPLKGWGAETLTLEKQKNYSAMRAAQFTQMINSDNPQTIVLAKKAYDESVSKKQILVKDRAAMDRMFDAVLPQSVAKIAFDNMRNVGATSQDEIIDFVLMDLEGGAAVVEDGNGAKAQYGLNSAANPDIPIGSLTQDQAKKYAKERYWDSLNIDSLPDNMKLLAFNASFHFGQKVAKDMIEKSGNDPDKMMLLSEKYLQNLTAKNPEKYGKNRAGWDNRLSKIAQKMASDISLGAAQKTAQELDMQVAGAGEAFINLVKKSAEDKRAIKKAEEDNISEEVNKILYENNGDFTKIPSSLRAKAAYHGVDVTSFKGVDDPATRERLDLMSSQDLFSTDLNAPEYARNLSYGTLQAYKKRQADLQDPENKFMHSMIDGTAEYYFKASGKKLGTYEQKELFKGMKEYMIYKAQAYSKSNNGTPPTQKDITKFAAEFLHAKKASFFGRENYTIDDFTDEQRAAAEETLMNSGQSVTEEGVLSALIYSKKAGLLDE